MIQFHQEALKSIAKGIKTLAKAVIVTLGPRGRNVVIMQDNGTVSSTKDGVTVAKEVALKDHFENMGASLIKEAASKAAEVTGDGTTTAIVLGEAIFTEGLKNVSAGANPMDIKRGIDVAVQAVIQELGNIATPIKTPDEIEQIASLSANNDPIIGAIIKKAMQKVGKDGIVTIGEAKGIDTTLEIKEGMQFDRGYLSPYFVTNAEKMAVEFDNPFVLVTDKKISDLKELVPILEKIQNKGPLLIIADDVDGDALATLVINKVKGGLPLCAVKAPAFGDRRQSYLEDIAILTGAEFFPNTLGALGRAGKITVTKDETTLIDGKGNAQKIKERTAHIKAELNQPKITSYERQKLEERLAKFVGGVAVINVGAATETEAREKKDRIDDALHATRAATKQGIVPGGGVALIRAAKALESLQLRGDEALGVSIIKKACFAPAIAIATNCGKNGAHIAEKISEASGNTGYNGVTDTFCDLVKEGVIDPVLVTKSALKHAASVSGLLITVAATITTKK